MGKTIHYGNFEWDEDKDEYNQKTHHMGFRDAIQAFLDHKRIVAKDELHSAQEERLFCIGLANGKVTTVRFTARADKIRIIGAGLWRKGKKLYEEKNGK